MTEIYTVYIYHVSNRKRSLAEKSFILCYFMQKNVKVSAWHKVSKHLCWHPAVLRTVVGINISFSLSKPADAKVSYFYFNINKTSPVDVKKDNAEIQKTAIINIYAVNSKENDRKMFPFGLKPSRLQEANSTSTLFTVFHLLVGFLSFLQPLFSRSHGS